MGNIGAYIGLFLGYSALQIPDLIQLVSRNFKKYLAKSRSIKHNVVPYTTKIHVKEDLPEIINQISTTNPNFDVLCMIHEKLEHISQRIDTLEKFTLKMNQKLEEIVEGNK